MKKYYKVIKDGKVIDVLDKLVYFKWQPKNKIMVRSDLTHAEVIRSSDMSTLWHEMDLNDVPVDGYDTVKIEEINIYEYKQLRCLNMKTPEAIIDEFVLNLLEGGIL